MPPRRSRRNQPAAEVDTIVLRPQETEPAAPSVTLDSDSDDDFIPSTYTSTFTIPPASGIPIPSFARQQPADQARVEATVPPTAPGRLHALSPQAIDDMINSAVTRALHRATSAQSLTTPQTDSLPRQLLPNPLPPPTFPAPAGFSTIAGLHGQQYLHSAAQGTDPGFAWETGSGGQFSFPGIPLPPITDPKIISLQALLPEVDPRVMKKVLDETFTPTDVLLLVPLESRNKAKALLRDDFLDMANITKDPRDFSMLHLAPAIYNYAAIVIYFAPDRTKGPLAAAFATYVSRLMSWAERYFFRAILQYHVHFHARIISMQGVYRAEAWSAEAPHLMGSYITPNVRPISFESRKRQHTDISGPRHGGSGGGPGAHKGRGDGRCWNWNAGRPCVRDPCSFVHLCSADGCGKAHKGVDHRPDRK